MARGRHERPDEADEVTPADEGLESPPDTDPVSDQAESERAEEPSEIHVDLQQQEDQERGAGQAHEEHQDEASTTPEVPSAHDAPSLAERAGAVARRAVAGRVERTSARAVAQPGRLPAPDAERFGQSTFDSAPMGWRSSGSRSTAT